MKTVDFTYASRGESAAENPAISLETNMLAASINGWNILATTVDYLDSDQCTKVRMCG